MFHRPRPGLQVRPALSSDGTEVTEIQEDDVSAPTADAPEDSVIPAAPVQDEPVAAAPFSEPTSFQPQPVQEKEAEPMSNTYNNNQNFPADTGAADTAPQMPTTSSFTSPQQRMVPMQPAVRSPYAYGAPSYVGTDASVSTGRKLVLGEGITMSGEIEACDHLVVEGTVEASLKGASILDVSQSGMFFGAVEINEATIAGRFEGDLVVNGRLTVRATGTITGTISYKELAVEAGATIDGKILPMREGRVVSSEKKGTGVNQGQKSKGQNGDGELFVKAAQQSAA